jgi:hypothetical protein
MVLSSCAAARSSSVTAGDCHAFERHARCQAAASFATIISLMTHVRTASLTGAVLATTVLAMSLAGAQPAYEPPRLRDGKPDLQGIWQVRNTANWDLEHHAGSFGIPAGLGVVVDPADGVIPYKPAAAQQQQRNFEERETRDPVASCYIAGVPRTMYSPHPLQIFQTPAEVVILSEYVHTTRWIPLTELPRYEGYESWIGDSRGHWDGDTLVVETVGFNGQTWLDHSGNFHSTALRVVERFARTESDVITYEATLEDPEVFTRPWTIRMPLYLHRDRDRLLENECYLYAEDAGRPIIGRHPE